MCFKRRWPKKDEWPIIISALSLVVAVVALLIAIHANNTNIYLTNITLNNSNRLAELEINNSKSLAELANKNAIQISEYQSIPDKLDNLDKMNSGCNFSHSMDIASIRSLYGQSNQTNSTEIYDAIENLSYEMGIECAHEQVQVCIPDTKRCVGSELQQCIPTGTNWTTISQCPNGCNPSTLACNPASGQMSDITILYVIIALIVVVAVLIVLQFLLRRVLT